MSETTRKTDLLRKITVLFVICLFALPARAKYGGGVGEPNDPYLIYTAEQMNAIGADSNDWDKHFLLCADIDLSAYTGTEFNVIGVYVSYNDPKNKPFTGVFDGNGHTITNFTYTSTGVNSIGLFKYVRWGLIKDLGLISPNVDAGTRWYVGSLVGRLRDGTITNCYDENGSVVGGYHVGGLVGSIYKGTITNCYSTASVFGTTVVGGLVGINSYGRITNSYSTGRVSGDEHVGGLVGSGGTVLNSFWDTESSGQTTSARGTGKTTAEMQMASTFISWGCEPVWTIDEGKDYPRLLWENKPGEPIILPSYGGGSGTQADPYLIYTADHLNMIALVPCHLGKHFKLMTDIDLAGFTGTSFNIIRGFTGVFDGNGHTISNFSYTSTNTDNIGFFGYVSGYNTVIKDIGLINAEVDAEYGRNVGSLVGLLREGTVSGCYVNGGIVAGKYCVGVGGLVGDNILGTIDNCYSEGIVSGYEDVGGMVGDNHHGIIANCYSAGSVAGTEYSAGGLVGGNSSLSTVTNCYSEADVSGNCYVGGLAGRGGTINDSYSVGSVSGNEYVGGLTGKNSATITNSYAKGPVSGDRLVGGLIGFAWGTISNSYSRGDVLGTMDVGGMVGLNYGIISNCYSKGDVSGNENVGGLVGRNWQGEVNNSFWDIETSGQTISDGGTGKTTAEMQMMSTFTDADWDFENIWWILEGTDYPHLWWERMEVAMKLTPGTLNCRSKGGWVKAHFVLPADLTVEDVDSDILGRIESLGIEADYMDVFVDEDGLVRVEMAFDRAVLCEGLTGAGSVEITVGGFLINGRYFYGTEAIKIK